MQARSSSDRDLVSRPAHFSRLLQFDVAGSLGYGEKDSLAPNARGFPASRLAVAEDMGSLSVISEKRFRFCCDHSPQGFCP